MRLYGDYVINELGELDTDYVFVNLWDGEIGRPLTYSAVYDLFRRLEHRTGIDTMPPTYVASAEPSSDPHHRQAHRRFPAG